MNETKIQRLEENTEVEKRHRANRENKRCEHHECSTDKEIKLRCVAESNKKKERKRRRKSERIRLSDDIALNIHTVFIWETRLSEQQQQMKKSARETETVRE